MRTILCLVVLMFSAYGMKAQCNDLLDELMTTADEARNKEIIKNIKYGSGGWYSFVSKVPSKVLEQPTEPKRRDLILEW